MKLSMRNRSLFFPRRPLVMGIVNLSDDSFSGDGMSKLEDALDRASRFVAAGADIIDVGAESARTNRDPIAPAEEIARLAPFLDRFQKMFRVNGEVTGCMDAKQVFPPLLSVNTWRPEVSEAVLGAGPGVDILNDIGGLLESARNAEICAKTGAALVVMHTAGPPKRALRGQDYADIVGALDRFFRDKLEVCREAGLEETRIILDPGIGFAKETEADLAIYRETGRLSHFGRPILLPVSRKEVVGEVLGIRSPVDRDPGTIACLTAGLLRGASIFRLHNVAAAARVIKVLDALTG